MNRQLTVASSVQELYYDGGEAARAMDLALANLMISCLQGRFPRFIRGSRHERFGHDAAIQWQDQDGQVRSFILEAKPGRYHADNPPASGPHVADAGNSVDKMLHAISENWAIKAFRHGPAIAVINWDRRSHGNHPAVVLHNDTGTLATYYEAPAEYATGDDPAL